MIKNKDKQIIKTKMNRKLQIYKWKLIQNITKYHNSI